MFRFRAVSDIPVAGLVAGVRVGCIDGKFVVNPSVPDMSRSTLDLVVAGTEDSVLMIEVPLPGVCQGCARVRKGCVSTQRCQHATGVPGVALGQKYRAVQYCSILYSL